MNVRRMVFAGLAAVSALCGSALATIDVRVNFNTKVGVTDANWNNITATSVTNQAMTNYATGNTTDGVTASFASIRGTVSIGTTSNNWQATNPGPSWLDSGQNAAKDNFSENTNSGMQLTFNGLNPNLKYSIEAISSTSNSSGYDNQNSPWVVIGAVTSATTNFNSVTQGYQSGQWLSWTGISPNSSGQITVRVGTYGGNTPNLYINAVRLYYTPPVITTSSPLPDGLVGTAYSQTLAATGGASPYTWSISSGSLPGSLSLSNGGVISGTPTTQGTSNFTVQVTDSSGVSATQNFALTIDAAPTITTQPQSQTATVGESVSLFVAAAGIPAPTYQWQKNGSNITGATNATLTFGPVALTDAANYACVVTNSVGSTTSNTATLTVNAAPSITTTSPLPQATVGAAYNQTLAATGGTAPLSWSVISGSLPANLTLSGAGVISGTPTTSGTANFTVQVQDSNGISATQAFALTVNAALSITTSSPLPQGTVGSAYNQTLTATGGTAPLAWSLISGSLPANLTLSAGGVISGTPTTSGTANFTVQVQDANNVTTTKAFALTINATLSITTSSPLPQGTVGSAYSQTLTATGGTAPLSWSVISGSLPANVTLSTAGVISGTPTTAGTANFTAQVQDANSVTATKAFALTVNSAVSIIDVRVDLSSAAAVTDANWNTIDATNASNVAMVNYATGSTSDGITASVVSLRGTISRGTTTNNWQSIYFGPAWMDNGQNSAKDYFSEGSNSGMQLVFNGLNPSLTYTIEVVSSTHNGTGYDNQNSTWQAIGLSTSSQQFNSYANGYQAGNWITWNNIAPDATGCIKVQVGNSGGSTPNLYMNAVRLYRVTASTTTITTSSPLPYGTVGIAYGRTLEVAGGTAPYTWSVTSGNLPAGLTLSSAGVITGTPTTPGTTNCTIKATDANNVSDSKSFAMTVNQAPTITTQPQSQTVTVGQSATFSVVATGSPAPTYQWQQNGTNISGFTSASMTLNPVVASDAGSYTCVVSNVAGTVNSNTVTLTVNPADTTPVVNAGNNQAVTLPAQANLSGSATGGTGTYTYSWSTVSGPGTVTFGNSHAASTTASFSAYGIYVLQLAASDGQLTGYGTTTITVNPATPVTMDIEDFLNTTDGTYNSGSGNQVTGQSHLPNWVLGGKYFQFEAYNGVRMMVSTQSYGGLDLGIKLAQNSSDGNEYEPVWDSSLSANAISLANVDQLQFTFTNCSAHSGAQTGDANIYMYYYDTSAATAKTLLICVIPGGTNWSVGQTQTFTANLSSMCIDKAADLVYGFRINPSYININYSGSPFGLSSIAAVNGAFPTNRISIVSTGTTYPTLQTAASAASSGDTIQIASGTYTGYQVWTQVTKNSLTIRGVGPTRPVMDSANNCILSKAAILFTANDGVIDNLEICNARAGNAAAVRVEGINLTITNSYLHDSGDGLLESNIHDSNITLLNDEFNHCGDGSGSTHNMYIGHCATLTMMYCYSHNAVIGHEVKTRARSNYILYNRCADDGGQSSYEISEPCGGTTYIIGNQVEQGPNAENNIILDYGSENTAPGQNPNPDQHLYVLNNTVINDLSGGYWLRTQSDTVALVQNNIFQGTANWWGPSTQLNNWITSNAHLVLPASFDYHLTTRSTGAINLGGVPNPSIGIDGFSLIPDKQYMFPCNYITRPVNGTIDIGAYEYPN